RRVTARASTSDDQPIAVGFAAFDQVTRAVHAIVYVDYAPLPVQPAAILGAVAGAPAVVHIQHAEAATGPVLNGQLERHRARRSRTTVTDHDQRRPFIFGSFIVGVRWRIKKRMRG